ncbi:MAG: hypothetical protein IJR36_02550 [Lachnospiraceae bacterium]|nr:hypothetical protein [Lachnospiraceae bacterium]
METKLPERITVSDLSRSSGVNTKTIYNHFPDGIEDFHRFFTEQMCFWTKDLLRTLHPPGEPLPDDLFSRRIVHHWSTMEAPHRLDLLRTDYMIKLMDQIIQSVIDLYDLQHEGDSIASQFLAQARIRAYWGAVVELIYQHAAIDINAPQASAFLTVIQESLYHMHQIIYQEPEEN